MKLWAFGSIPQGILLGGKAFLPHPSTSSTSIGNAASAGSSPTTPSLVPPAPSNTVSSLWSDNYGDTVMEKFDAAMRQLQQLQLQQQQQEWNHEYNLSDYHHDQDQPFYARIEQDTTILTEQIDYLSSLSQLQVNSQPIEASSPEATSAGVAPLSMANTPSSSSPTVPTTRLRNFALNAITKASSSSIDQWFGEELPPLESTDLELARALDIARFGSLFVGDDRVEIDVGGRVFRTSKATLMQHSTYFQNRFLSHDLHHQQQQQKHQELGMTPWETLTPTGEPAPRIFLDQDSDAFQVLLTYMRVGYIEATDLTAKVLALADILGLESLLRAVKCVAFLYLNPSLVTAKEHVLVQRFDEAYGGIMTALKNGILPHNLRPVPPERTPSQIAQLLVYDGWVANFQKTDLSLFVEVKVTANVLAQEGLYHPRAEGFDTVVVPDCHTLHDAINWLYNRGFEFTENEYHTIPFPNEHKAWENLWFTRPMVSPHLQASTNLIRFDPLLYPQAKVKRRKIASLLLSHDQMDAFLYADKGRKTSMGFPPESNSGLPSTLPQALRNQGFDSHISMESSRNAWAVLSWLSEHGYTEMSHEDPHVTKLRKLMLEIQYRAYSHQEDKAVNERKPVDQDLVDFRLLSCNVTPDAKLFETWPTGPFE